MSMEARAFTPGGSSLTPPRGGMLDDLTLVIQAGGRSRRMGADKALMSFRGRPLIQRVKERLEGLAVEMLVTTNQAENYVFLGLPLVADILPGHGALGGLYTALASASRPCVAVVACDMPFASASLLRLAHRILLDEGADLVVPRSPGGLEPLQALYRRQTCLPAVLAALEAGELKTIDWFGRVRGRELTPDEIATADPTGRAFWNVNTRQELEAAELEAGAEG
jgi:molybdopterin-guanine dinucleotide biosynthesis protein A